MGSDQSKIRLQVGVDRRSPVNKRASLGNITQMSAEICRDASRNQKVVGKGSSGSGTGLDQPRLLQQVFRGAEEGIGEVARNFGPESAKYVHRKGEIQDGYCRDHQAASQTGRLGHFSGPYRCLPPHTYSPSISQVSQVRLQRPGIPIPLTTHGSDNIAKNIYESDQMYKVFPTQTFSQDTPVSRRLVGAFCVQEANTVAHRSYCTANQEFRFHCQPREVRVEANSGHHVPGVQVQIGHRHGMSNTREVDENSGEDSSVYAAARGAGAAVAVDAGGSNRYREAGTSRYVTPAAHSSGDAGAVVPIQRQSISVTNSITRSPSSIEVVVGKDKCDAGSTFETEQASTSSVYRCQYERMGRTSGWDESARSVDRDRERTSHKCAGAGGSVESARGFCAAHREQSCHDCIRQYNDSGVYQEARGNQVSNIVGSDTRVLHMARNTPDNSGMQAYSGEAKCLSGQSIQSRRNSANGVVSTSQNTGSSMGSLGQASSGYVCHERQLQTSDICITHPGSTSDGSGRLVNRVDKPVYVLFPSDSDSQQGTGQDASSPLCSYTDSTSLAQAKMVSRHSRDAGGLPSGTSAVAEIATTTQVVNLSPQAGSVSSSRLEIIQRSHSHRGFSEEASHRMARAQKASSIAVYEGKWKAFTHWCKGRNANPLKADAQLVADFLCHLHNEKKLAYSTIEGYRTAIRSTVLAARSEDINGDQRLSALMANFARDRSKRKSSIPNWDLSLVLLMLTKQPFEPIHKASIKHVTWKTVFLVALASGKRRGELHAIRREILHTKDWRSVTLVPDTEFVAKTELGNKGADVLKPITFPALTKLLDASMQEDRSLCPVRAIKQYLELTKESRGPRRKLFIAYKAGWDNTKEIHANTVSTWIKKVILMAYENASEEDKKVMKVTAHQVRGMAASWALHRNVAMEAVMDACSWKAHNTFTQYYLKDLALISEEMYHLGPVIAAQHSA